MLAGPFATLFLCLENGLISLIDLPGQVEANSQLRHTLSAEYLCKKLQISWCRFQIATIGREITARIVRTEPPARRMSLHPVSSLPLLQ